MSAESRTPISLPHLFGYIVCALAGAYCLYVVIVVAWSLL